MDNWDKRWRRKDLLRTQFKRKKKNSVRGLGFTWRIDVQVLFFFFFTILRDRDGHEASDTRDGRNENM